MSPDSDDSSDAGSECGLEQQPKRTASMSRFLSAAQALRVEANLIQEEGHPLVLRMRQDLCAILEIEADNVEQERRASRRQTTL